MQIFIDAEKCQGHNRCYALAPELVDVDDLGMAVLLGDGSVPVELEAKARLLVANCPEYAITIAENVPADPAVDPADPVVDAAA
jgi:ferredoxin